MSLRTFHIIFIIVTVILSLYVCVWGLREFAADHSTTGLTLAIVFMVTAVGLVVYGKKAFAKLRDLP